MRIPQSGPLSKPRTPTSQTTFTSDELRLIETPINMPAVQYGLPVKSPSLPNIGQFPRDSHHQQLQHQYREEKHEATVFPLRLNRAYEPRSSPPVTNFPPLPVSPRSSHSRHLFFGGTGTGASTSMNVGAGLGNSNGNGNGTLSPSPSDYSNSSFLDLYGDETEEETLGTVSNTPTTGWRVRSPQRNGYDPDTTLRKGVAPSPLGELGSPSRISAGGGGSGGLEEDVSDNGSTLSELGFVPSMLSSMKLTDDHHDRYGFKKQSSYITEEQYDAWWEDYEKFCTRRKLKWKLFLEKSGIPMIGGHPAGFPARSEKLKRYVRKGIPPEWRGYAWWYFAKGDEALNNNIGVYDELVARFKKIMKLEDKEARYPDLEVIERDLNRTFPDNIHFQKDASGSEEKTLVPSLRRVLFAYSLYNPQVGYCQSMNFLAGLLLLFLPEEKSFWMLVIITSRYLPNVHDITLEGVNVDQGVLMLCVKEYLPEIWSYIQPKRDYKSDADGNKIDSKTRKILKNQFLFKLPPITLCTASWFMSCFVGVLPIETTLRIWDCLFYEGSHFLFKASLAILKLSESELLKGKSHTPGLNYITQGGSAGDNHRRKHPISREESDMELFQIVQSFPKRLLNPNEIFEKIIFKRRIAFNNLDQDEVDRCRKYVSTQRQKYKKYVEETELPSPYMLGETEVDHSKQSSEHSMTLRERLKFRQVSHEDLGRTMFLAEEYGFKRRTPGVNWNNSLKEKVKFMRIKKGKHEE